MTGRFRLSLLTPVLSTNSLFMISKTADKQRNSDLLTADTQHSRDLSSADKQRDPDLVSADEQSNLDHSSVDKQNSPLRSPADKQRETAKAKALSEASRHPVTADKPGKSDDTGPANTSPPLQLPRAWRENPCF